MDNQKEGIRVRRSRPFKLKAKEGRNFTFIHLKDFGFIPDVIIIERADKNMFTVSAVLTEAEKKREDEFFKTLNKEKMLKKDQDKNIN